MIIQVDVKFTILVSTIGYDIYKYSSEGKFDMQRLKGGENKIGKNSAPLRSAK
jgi:hypothetical protein